MSTRFVPPHPPRGAGPVAVWRGFVGERARTAVYGWSEQAFTAEHMRRTVMGIEVHMPLTPQAAQHVLLDNAANYVKPRIVKKILGRTIGEGLLTADGALWRDQRRIVAASFTPPAVDALVPVFADVARSAAAGWEAGTRDMALAATGATMRVISDALFSGDARLTSGTAMQHIVAALEGVSEARLQAILGLPIVPLSRKGRAAHRGQAYLRQTLAALVNERLGGGGPGDFLGAVIRALADRFPARQARELAVDNAATFYLAGHETTANAITWTLFLLSEQPALQEQAAAESRAALHAGIDSELPDRLPLLRRILEESMRLYPPVPRIDREATGPDRIGEHDIAPGTIVSIWPWLLHRHKGLWDDPDVFHPDRFTPEARAGRHRFQYLPFGGGPRMCVGMRFAMAEALTILAEWIAGWHFAPVPGREVRVSGLVTLRPAGGLPLRLEPRR
jgi:cytochrome P450